MKYQIVREDSADELAREVAEQIGRGWAPLGGVAVAHGQVEQSDKGYDWTETFTTWAQAMTKTEDA